jgi:hypothetical protein
MNGKPCSWGLALGLLLWAAGGAFAATLYVKSDAAGAGTGASWANAYPDLQSALAAAQWNDQIWVAAGPYKPTTGADRTVSFVLTQGVALYGGFTGVETELADRDWVAHETILSGNIGLPDATRDNSYHVVRGASFAELDGFTIRAVDDAAHLGLDREAGAMLMIESDAGGAAAEDELDRAERACQAAGATSLVRAKDATEADWLREARRAAHSSLERAGVGFKEHVRFFYTHEAVYGRAVEHAALLQDFRKLLRGYGYVLQYPEHVRELKAYELDVVFFDHL